MTYAGLGEWKQRWVPTAQLIETKWSVAPRLRGWSWVEVYAVQKRNRVGFA